MRIIHDAQYQGNGDRNMAHTVTNKDITVNSATKKKRRLKPYIPLFIMMTPGLLFFLINNYLPMLGMVIAFKDINFTKGILGSDWVGFKNFEYLFKTQDAYIITRNTILYNGAFIILGLIFAVGTAILLNELRVRIFTRFYQSMILIPHLISYVILAYLVFALLSLSTGYVNHTIMPMLGLEPIYWYMESKYWPFILTVVNLWKSIGFSTLIYFAAIIGISEEYYEAARLDGATKWQQIRKITIPLITPVIILMLLLNIGQIFYSDFGLFYQVPMNSGMIYDTTDVIDTYVFRGLLGLGNLGMSAAAGVYQSIVEFTLVLISNFIIRKVSKENALF